MTRNSIVRCLPIFLGLLLLVGVFGNEGAHWSYSGDDGPAEWGNHYPNCDLKHQSPIDIKVSWAEFDPWLGPLKLRGYCKRQGTLTLKNNGHSGIVHEIYNDIGLVTGITTYVEVVLEETFQVDTLNGRWIVSCGSLKDRYKLLQFHFHWGIDSNNGSEHTINSKRYPLEMHMVHMSTRCNDISEALRVKKSIVVLGVLFEVGKADNPAFDELTDKLRFSKYKGEGTTLATFALRTLMPRNLADYYTYDGSLTTPPCSEVVVWNIFRQTVKISENQLNAFRRLKTFVKGDRPPHGDFMSGNFRPIQPLNGRIVRKTWWC